MGERWRERRDVARKPGKKRLGEMKRSKEGRRQLRKRLERKSKEIWG